MGFFFWKSQGDADWDDERKIPLRDLLCLLRTSFPLALSCLFVSVFVFRQLIYMIGNSSYVCAVVL